MKRKTLHIPFSTAYPALQFKILSKCSTTRARTSLLALPHGPIETPVFMPVGTNGTMKGLTPEQMTEIGFQIILSNTYHLSLRPGSDLIEEFDSGGFQMVSLVKLSKVTEEGVTFNSPIDGTPMLLTPEKSIQIQNQIGSDIIMMLDDVVSSVAVDNERFLEATHRTIRWLDRCIAAHTRPHDQNLFGIVQGGLDVNLREWCLTEMMKRDEHLPGYAIGGISGGEDKNKFWRVVEQCTKRLPESKPRYCMGVGYPIDLVVCTALGVDMYDCVYPCRTARFGTALYSGGVLRLKSAQFAHDLSPIDPECGCFVCKQFTRAYLYTIVTHDTVGAHLVTYHNMYYMKNLMRTVREAILKDEYPSFIEKFLRKQLPNGVLPAWISDALKVAGMTIDPSWIVSDITLDTGDDVCDDKIDK